MANEGDLITLVNAPSLDHTCAYCCDTIASSDKVLLILFFITVQIQIVFSLDLSVSLAVSLVDFIKLFTGEDVR